MKFKRFIPFFIIVVLLLGISCKAKRCASFENQDKEYKLKYDRQGRVRK